MMTDYYKCLGVMPQASEQEIKTAYRKLAKKYHPDAIGNHPEWANKMYEIQAAYGVLGDQEKRKKYDEGRKLKAGREENVSPKGANSNPEMSQFERFFGFQPGRGMETYRDKESGGGKKGGTINVDQLFEAYFGVKKK